MPLLVQSGSDRRASGHATDTLRELALALARERVVASRPPDAAVDSAAAVEHIVTGAAQEQVSSRLGQELAPAHGIAATTT
jgi:hypothetical protein